MKMTVARKKITPVRTERALIVQVLPPVRTQGHPNSMEIPPARTEGVLAGS